MARTSSDSTKTIGAVDRALAILELFNERTPELGITEMAIMTKLHKSTLAGLVYTLERRGYLFQNADTRKYRLGLRLAERAQVALNKFAVTEFAHPHMAALLTLHDESINLAVLENMQVVYIDHMSSSQPLGVHVKIGKRAQISTTALGKAIVAFLPPADQETIISKITLDKMTPNSIATPAELRADLERTRARGFALDDEENELGGRCVSSPIFDWAGRVVAGISMSAPVQRFTPALIERYGADICETAAAISQDMGYRAGER
jgi:IclR family transcriptional regulator, KDG regulon repressor